MNELEKELSKSIEDHAKLKEVAVIAKKRELIESENFKRIKREILARERDLKIKRNVGKEYKRLDNNEIQKKADAMFASEKKSLLKRMKEAEWNHTIEIKRMEEEHINNLKDKRMTLFSESKYAKLRQEMRIEAKIQAKEYYRTRIEKLEDVIGRKIEF